MKLTPQTSVLSFIALGLLAVVVYRATSARPLDWHARRLADCVGRGDSACVLGYVPSDEAQQLRLTEESISWLLKELEIKRGPALSVKLEEIEQWKMATVTYVSVRGGNEEVSFAISDTDEGIKSPMLTSSLLLGRMSPDNSSGVTMLQSRMDYVRKNKAELERRGFRGFVPDFGKPLISWDEFLAQNEARLARVQAAQANQPARPGG